MADDQTNPYTMLGMANMMMPNPYTQYKGALPMPGYRGSATDAQGNVIPSWAAANNASNAWAAANPTPAQGTTLNSTPASATSSTPWSGSVLNQSPIGQQMLANQQGTTANPAIANGGYGPNGSLNAWQQELGQQLPVASTSSTPASTAQNPIDMRQAYLDALANPGKVTTPGATVAPSAPLGQPSVLSSFLAAHPSGGGAGAGNYNNSGFFNTLNQLGSR